jgi:hypothetical protein
LERRPKPAAPAIRPSKRSRRFIINIFSSSTVE